MTKTTNINRDYIGISPEVVNNWTATQRTKVEQCIKLLQPEALEIVQNLETDLMRGTTQNNYGYYMKWILRMPDNIMKVIMSNALVRAGGNRIGIMNALKLSV